MGLFPLTLMGAISRPVHLEYYEFLLSFSNSLEVVTSNDADSSAENI